MKFIFLILMSIFIVIFAIQNSIVVSVSLFNKTFEGSLALVIILCYSLGVLSGFLYIIPTIIKKNITISELKEKLNNKQIKDTKKSL